MLFLRAHDDAPYRAIVLKAVTEDLRHERDVEQLRSRYAVDLMRAAREPEFYREAVLAAVADPGEEQSEGLLVEIAAILAEEGDAEARQAVYDAYQRHRHDDTWTGVEEIARLDGAPGLLRALSGLEAVDWREDAWFLGMVIEDTVEAAMGRDEAWRALDEGASGNDRLTEALTYVREHRRECETSRERTRTGRRRPPARYDELLRLLDGDLDKARYAPRRWGVDAAEEDLRRAAHALAGEADHDRRLALLRVFGKRPFPLDPATLIALADSDDWETATNALIALENMRHPSVRACALRVLRDPERGSHAVDMLSANFEEGDHALIEWLAEQPEVDPHEEHGRGMNIRKFLKTHPHPDSARTLLLTYEKTGCGFCRYWLVKSLVDSDALPLQIREECLFDSHMDTRFLAEHGYPPGE